MSEKEQAEEAKEDKKTKGPSKLPLYITIFAVVLAFAVGLLIGPNLTGNIIAGGSQQAGQKAVDYINQNLLQPGISCSMINSTEKSGLYEVWISISSAEGSTILPVWVSRDGSLLFTSGIDMSAQTASAGQTGSQTFDAPNSEKPVVELFVMSFCPYGVQAENLMKPVVDLIGADFKVRFIASVTGNSTDSVQSLHGPNEAKEDLRQVCIQKYYPDRFWDYLMDVNSNCYPVYRNETALDACWKSAAGKFGIDTSKIEACAYGSEGLSLLRADEKLAEQYDVRGSPTLIINGARYDGTRSSEDFKQAVCSGFASQPAECGQALSGSGGSAPAGGCG